MALGSMKMKMSTRNTLVVKAAGAYGCAAVKNSRSLNFLDPSGPAWPVMGVLYLYLVYKHINNNGILSTEQ